jgi:potassium efflux system protein
MREAVAEHNRILEDPEPLVTFEDFGDSALIIALRCYIESMDHRLQTHSELNEAINRKFADAGIEIAFPQRDIHLDTSQPLDVRLHRTQEEPGQ